MVDSVGLQEIISRNKLMVSKFVTAAGNSVFVIGTVSLDVVRDDRGYCNHGFGMRAGSVCCECLLNYTIDIIKVNGMAVSGGYRRGTILKMAGLSCAGIEEICRNDKKISEEMLGM